MVVRGDEQGLAAVTAARKIALRQRASRPTFDPRSLAPLAADIRRLPSTNSRRLDTWLWAAPSVVIGLTSLVAGARKHTDTWKHATTTSAISNRAMI